MPKVDVATMAHSLEARAPLLDHEVLEFALGLRTTGSWMGMEENRFLKRLLARFSPADLFRRPKHAFSVPFQVWFAGGPTSAWGDQFGGK